MEKVEPFLASQTFGKGRCVTILPMYQLHISALLDIRVAKKNQTEGHNGSHEIHLHLKLPSFSIESSTSLKKEGGESVTACLTQQHYVPRMIISSIRWGTSNVTWLSLAILHVSMTHLSTTLREKISHLIFQSSATRISENLKKCENVLFAKLTHHL